MRYQENVSILKYFIIVFLFFFHTQLLAIEQSKAIEQGVKVCRSDDQQFKASKMSRSQYDNFCKCYITNMVKLFDEKEKRYQKKYKKPSGNFMRKSRGVLKTCT